MKLSEKLIILSQENLQTTQKPMGSQENSSEFYSIPTVIDEYLKNDEKLRSLLEKTPSELVGEEKKLLYAISSDFLHNENQDYSLIYLFSKYIWNESKTNENKMLLLLENKEGKLRGWGEYRKKNIEGLKVAYGIKISRFFPAEVSIEESQDFLNLLYNLTHSYDVIAWVADPTNNRAIPIYNRIFNICNGKTTNLKETPYNIKITPDNMYYYMITKKQTQENNLWQKIPHRELALIEEI